MIDSTMNKLVIYAKDYAYNKHLGQVRKITGEPYFNHLARVAGLVSGVPFPIVDVNIACCSAWLHDVIEDCYTDECTQRDLILDIQAKFGIEVKWLCKELTNQFTKENYPSWNRKDRKQGELDRLCGITKIGKTIKCADRIDNLLDFKTNDVIPRYYRNESWDLYDKALKGETYSPYLETLLETILESK